MRISAHKIEPGFGGQILDYLSRNPEAQDTLEGIVQWWLLEQRIVTAVGKVKEALGELVRMDLVQTRQGLDGQTYYRLNPATKLQAGALPNKSKTSGPETVKEP